MREREGGAAGGWVELRAAGAGHHRPLLPGHGRPNRRSVDGHRTTEEEDDANNAGERFDPSLSASSSEIGGGRRSPDGRTSWATDGPEDSKTPTPPPPKSACSSSMAALHLHGTGG